MDDRKSSINTITHFSQQQNPLNELVVSKTVKSSKKKRSSLERKSQIIEEPEEYIKSMLSTIIMNKIELSDMQLFAPSLLQLNVQENQVKRNTLILPPNTFYIPDSPGKETYHRTKSANLSGTDHEDAFSEIVKIKTAEDNDNILSPLWKKLKTSKSSNEPKSSKIHRKKQMNNPKPLDANKIIKKINDKGYNNERLNIISHKNKEILAPIAPEKLGEFNTLCLKVKNNLNAMKKSSKKLTLDDYKEFESPSEEEEEKKEDYNKVIETKEKVEKEESKEEKFRKLLRKETNLSDSFSDDIEIDDFCDIYIEPLSKGKILFDLLVFVLTLFLIAEVPFEIIFRQNSEHFHKSNKSIHWMSIFADFVFFSDLVIGFFTAYTDLNENLVTNNKKILIRYLTSWFLLDFICAIPIESYFEIRHFMNSKFKVQPNIEMFGFLNFLKIFKLTQNSAVIVFYYHILPTKIGGHLVIILTVIFYLLISHVLTSIFIIIGLNEESSWIYVNGFEPTNYIETYFAGLYFIFTIVFGVGYGDFKIVGKSERMFAILILIAGVLLNSWLISTLSEYGYDFDLKRINKDKVRDFKRKMAVLYDIKRTYGIKDEAFSKIERFLIYNFRQQIFSSKEIFESLTHSLKCELIEFMYKPIINGFVFFKTFKNRDFVVEVITHFHPAIYLKNERLINKGEYVEEMLFVKNGRLSVELPLSKNICDQIESFKEISYLKPKTSLKKLRKKTVEKFDIQYARLIEIRKNEHFGDIQMFLNKQNILSVRVSTKTAELYLLKKSDAIRISNSFPDIWKALITNSIYNMKCLKKLIRKVLKFFYQNNDKMLNELYIVHHVANNNSDDTDSSESSKEKKDVQNNVQTVASTSTYKDTNENLLSLNAEDTRIKGKKTKKGEPKKFALLRNLEKNDFDFERDNPTSSQEILTKLIKNDDLLHSERESIFSKYEDSKRTISFGHDINDSKRSLLGKSEESESNFQSVKLFDENNINEEFFQKQEEIKIMNYLERNQNDNLIITEPKAIPLKKISEPQKVEGFSLQSNRAESGRKKAGFNSMILKRRQSFQLDLKKKALPPISLRKKNLHNQEKGSIGRDSSFSLNGESGEDSEVGSQKGSVKRSLRHEKRCSMFCLPKCKNNNNQNSSGFNSNKVLSSIINNIEENSMNLNNPKFFYSNKFSNLINLNNQEKNK